MDQEYVDLAGLMGVKGWKLTLKVIFPAISPYVHGHSHEHSVRSDWCHRRRIRCRHRRGRFLIRMSAGIFKTADVFVGIIVLMIMVIILDKIAEAVERRALRWQTQKEHVQIQG